MFAYCFFAMLLGETIHHPIIEWEHKWGGPLEALAGFLGVLYVYVENSLKEH